MKVYQHLTQLIERSEHATPDQYAEELRDIEYLLPSGNGFDLGCTIHVDNSKPNRIRISTSYHHLSHRGYYTGWTHHSVIIIPTLTGGFDLYVTGPNGPHNVKGHIADMFDTALSAIVSYK